MGFFQKLKNGLSHAGVKVQLQAPSTVHLTDAQVPVTVTVTASSDAAQIKRVKASIICETSPNQSFAIGSGNASADSTTQILSQAQNAELFTLNPGESKTFEFNLAINIGAAVEQQLGKDSAGAKIAHAIGQLETLSQSVSNKTKAYRVEASADVDGVAFDATAIQTLQVLKPGEIGSSTTLNA